MPRTRGRRAVVRARKRAIGQFAIRPPGLGALDPHGHGRGIRPGFRYGIRPSSLPLSRSLLLHGRDFDDSLGDGIVRVVRLDDEQQVLVRIGVANAFEIDVNRRPLAGLEHAAAVVADRGRRKAESDVGDLDPLAGLGERRRRQHQPQGEVQSGRPRRMGSWVRASPPRRRRRGFAGTPGSRPRTWPEPPLPGLRRRCSPGSPARPARRRTRPPCASWAITAKGLGQFTDFFHEPHERAGRAAAGVLGPERVANQPLQFGQRHDSIRF